MAFYDIKKVVGMKILNLLVSCNFICRRSFTSDSMPQICTCKYYIVTDDIQTGVRNPRLLLQIDLIISHIFI